MIRDSRAKTPKRHAQSHLTSHRTLRWNQRSNSSKSDSTGCHTRPEHRVRDRTSNRQRKYRESHLPAKPRRPLRIIHTSDVHLETDTFGSGERGVQLRDKVRNSFARVIDIANDRNADLLLIVGDLFDSARVTEDGLAFAFGNIGRARMPVVLIPGNHDAHDERSIYAGLAPSALPSNLKLFLDPEGEVVEFPELEARIWGRALVEHRPEYRPLVGIPAPVPHQW